MGNLSEEFLKQPDTQRFQNTLENLLSATKIMLDELDSLLISFQAQTTEG